MATEATPSLPAEKEYRIYDYSKYIKEDGAEDGSSAGKLMAIKEFLDKQLPNLTFTGEISFEGEAFPCTFSVDTEGNLNASVSISKQTPDGKHTYTGKTQLPFSVEHTYAPRAMSCLSFTCGGDGALSLALTGTILHTRFGNLAISGKVELHKEDLPLRLTDSAHSLLGDDLAKRNIFTRDKDSDTSLLPRTDFLLGTSNSLHLVPAALNKERAQAILDAMNRVESDTNKMKQEAKK